VSNGADYSAVYEPDFLGGFTGVRWLADGDLGRRRYASSISATATLDADWAPYVQLPGYRFFDPEVDDQRLFSVPPTLSYDVPIDTAGISVSGELWGQTGSDALGDAIEAIVDADAGSARFPMPSLTLLQAQRGAVQFLDRQADRTNMDASLLANIDFHVPSPQVMSAWTGPVLEIQPTISEDLEITMSLSLGTRAFTVVSPEAINVAGVPSTIRMPYFEQPGVRTRFAVPDGGTVLLGGIQNEGDPTVTQGLPLLCDYPLLNFALSPSQKLGNRHLLVLLRPRLLNAGILEE
jgi:hypothetical protein